MERITGTANALRPARPISAVTVAIEPGPASRGIASGKMATSSFSSPSRCSSGVTRVRCGWARSISMAVRSSSNRPATLNAPSVPRNTWKIRVPATANSVSTKKATIAARRAMSRRFSGESPRVMAMKIGIAPIGSTTKKIAESESRLKLSHSWIMRPPPCRPASRACAPGGGSVGCSHLFAVYHPLLPGAPGASYHCGGGGGELPGAGRERQRHHLRARPGGALHLGEPGLRARHRLHARGDPAPADLGPVGARVPRGDGKEPLRRDADLRRGGGSEGRTPDPDGGEEPGRLPRADARRRAGDRARRHRATAGGGGGPGEGTALSARRPGKQRRALGMAPAGEPHLPLRPLEG